jgi:lipoic acid synthetase
MRDLREADCDMLTLGQYLRPSKRHLPVAEFVRPEVFERLEAEGRALGFSAVASAPFVRSSYHAGELAGSGGAADGGTSAPARADA